MEDVRQETLLANAAAPVPPPGSSFSGALPTNGTASRAADGSIVVNGHAANATKNNGLSNNDGDGASPPGAPPSDITAGSASASLADRPTGMPGSGSGGGDSEAEANPEDGEGDDENTQVGGDGDSATDANGAASSSATLGGGGDDKNKGSSPSRPPIRLRISSSGAGTTNAAGRKTSYVYSEHRSLALPRSVVEEALRTTRQSLETVCDFEAGGRGGLELL